MKEKYSIADLVKITGVSKRTLHYYDEVGILVPQKNKINGYREYSQNDVIELQQIMFYKSVGISIKEIKKIINSDDAEKRLVLGKYIGKIEKEISRLTNTKTNLEKFLEGESIKNLDIYDISLNEQYDREAKIRYGDTDEYKEFEKRDMKRSEKEKNQWNSKIEENLNASFEKFSEAMGESIDSENVRKAVMYWKETMLGVSNFSDEVLISISKVYKEDERFKAYFDKFRSEGIEDFIANSVEFHLKNK